jgi:hypothetical protein
MTVIPAFEECYVLGIDSMDQTHREFVDLVNQLAASDEAAFIPLLRQLVEHRGIPDGALRLPRDRRTPGGPRQGSR